MTLTQQFKTNDIHTNTSELINYILDKSTPSLRKSRIHFVRNRTRRGKIKLTLSTFLSIFVLTCMFDKTILTNDEYNQLKQAHTKKLTQGQAISGMILSIIGKGPVSFDIHYGLHRMPYNTFQELVDSIKCKQNEDDLWHLYFVSGGNHAFVISHHDTYGMEVMDPSLGYKMSQIEPFLKNTNKMILYSSCMIHKIKMTGLSFIEAENRFKRRLRKNYTI